MSEQTWRILFHSYRVEKAIECLPDDLLARFLRYAETMQKHGPDLGMPHTRAMGAGLLELRLACRGRIARVFFAVLSGRRIVFLHSFEKKTQKTPPGELAIARRRLGELFHE